MDKKSTIKKEHILGFVSLVLGILMIIDGIASIWTPANNHDLFLDFSRAVRILSGVVLIIAGAYIFWVNQA